MPGPLAPNRLHHVGVLVQDEQHVRDLLGLFDVAVTYSQYVPRYQADCIFCAVGDSHIEFVIPRGGKLTEFNRGLGGVHHFALEVSDLAATQAALAARGIQLLEPEPLDTDTMLINYVPPIHTRGVLVELIETHPRTAHTGTNYVEYFNIAQHA